MKKIVFIDTNMPNQDYSYYIHEIVAIGKSITAGDEIIAYQDGEEWDAIVTFKDGVWGASITSSVREISRNKEIGYIAGFWHGYYSHLVAIKNLLEQTNLSQATKDSIRNKLHIDINLGDEVIAYETGRECDAQVVLSNGGWGAMTTSETKEINDEKQIGYNEGFWEGYYCQAIAFKNVMKQLEIPQEDMKSILINWDIRNQDY